MIDDSLYDILCIIDKVTLQLWEKPFGNYDNWKPCASAVLVKDDNAHYLLTCSHSFCTESDKVSSFGFVRNITFYPLNETRYSSPDSDQYGKCDVAVLQLENSTAKDLKDLGHQFLPGNHLGINIPVNRNSRYFVCGYPANRTKVTYGKEGKKKTIQLYYDGKEVVFNTIVESVIIHLVLPYSDDDIKYQKLNLERHFHYLLDFHADKLYNIEGHRTALPKPQGLSGCGLWAIDSNNNYFLVGLMTDYHKKMSLMQATHIAYATELMREVFKASFQMSNIIQPKWFNENSIPENL